MADVPHRSETDDFDAVRKLAMELAAISESGLAYSTNDYDIGRFHQVGEVAHELSQKILLGQNGSYSRHLASIAGYTTPKLDVRGGVFDEDGRVLLVAEVADGDRWTLPGGWCDILETPSHAARREVWEEAGLKVRVTQLAGLLDREVWPHTPKFDRHMYKMLFVCEPLGELDPTYTSMETSGVGWFDVDNLPTLAISRTLPEQIRLLREHWLNPGPAYFD